MLRVMMRRTARGLFGLRRDEQSLVLDFVEGLAQGHI